ncbi:hypothetical protein [Candidatus Parabeggiatoa sp. HSG14]|uniref:hypothetical protein n=1 Tax=Candidatus Parabeggiatoa sp. HSG14 TaxID=3055593 RepID=UPI0025A766E4|nr:hypothetical protein [Thiotrichales bacterium HSG14]
MLSHFYKFISVIVLAFLLSCCATPRLSYSSFAKIQKGMTVQEVIDVMGEPTEVTDVSLETGVGAMFGLDSLSGINMIWIGGDAKANVIFVKNKVKSSNFTTQF